jgi:hypothetical protein
VCFSPISETSPKNGRKSFFYKSARDINVDFHGEIKLAVEGSLARKN